jgi:hypothetical protein
LRYLKCRCVWSPSDGVPEFGDAWWYSEFGPENTVTREVWIHDSGARLRYGPHHLHDKYGDLLSDVTLDECDLAPKEEISREEFEVVWNAGPWINDPTDLGAAPD